MPGQVKDNPESFGQRLRAIMTAQEIGSGRLAALSHVDVRLINKYKSGRVEPRNSFGSPTANAFKLARALGVQVEDLMPPRDPTAEKQAA